MIRETAVDVIQKEVKSLQAAQARLGEDFALAVDAIRSISGKVVVTGLGKSGHVGRKISATFSSTGTTSCYLHPTEALHGDLGVISSNDLLVAIAFGGETEEVLEVTRFAKRQGIPVVAITGKSGSSLAKLADIVIDGSVDREACPLNLAPTTSTTVAMVLGDALAISLMVLRGFREEHFANFHPQGALGRRLSLVQHHMRKMTELAPMKADDTFELVLEKVTKNNFGIGAVMDGSLLLGAITDGDLRRSLLSHRDEIFSFRASDLMTHYPKMVLPHTLAVDAFNQMEQSKVTSLFVVDDFEQKNLLGVVRMHDLIAAKIV